MSVDPAVENMIKESLLETAPASLGVANGVLTTTFERGSKGMGGYTYLLKLLIQHTLNLAEQNPNMAMQYKTAAIPMTYNLAANTWSGWGEDSAAVEEHHRLLGLEAARLNIDLAKDVGLGPERRKNGYWVLGAHLTEAGNYTDAIDAFEVSRDFARRAGDEEAELMAQGWIHMANTLAGVDETEQLAAIKHELEALGDDGAFFASQFAVAYGVFAPTR